jgi:tryptophan-rich sensory protein
LRVQIDWHLLILSIGVVALLAVIGAQLARGGLAGWYDTLEKPAWLIGTRVFLIVAVLYSAMAVALLYRGLVRPTSHERRLIIALTLLLLVANEVWNGLFLGLESVTLGFVGMLGFAAIVAALMIAFLRAGWRLEAAILSPYCLWIVYDIAWTFELWRLNALDT